MAKLKIRVHESRISRMRNKDAYYRWLEEEESDAPQLMDDDSGKLCPYFAVYVDNPENQYYDETELNAKIKDVMDYIRKNLKSVKGIDDVADYFDFDLIDGGFCDVDIAIVPKDELWDEDIDDIKYVANKAIHVIADAFDDGKVFSVDSLKKADVISPNVRE